MAKLIFEKAFELEVQDKIYTGVLKDLDKSQKKSFDKKIQQNKTKAEELNKLVKRIKKLQRNIQVAEKQENWDKVETLENDLDHVELQAEKLTDELNDNNITESIFKERIVISVISDDKDEILSIGEQYGYQNVFNTIIKSTQEIQEGN